MTKGRWIVLILAAVVVWQVVVPWRAGERYAAALRAEEEEPLLRDRTESADGFASARSMFAISLRPARAAEAAAKFAWAIHPNHNTEGDWDLALTAASDAVARLDGAEGREMRLRLSDALHLAGDCSQPGNAAAGDWQVAAPLFERAATVRAELQEHGLAAQSLYCHGYCIEPSRGPWGDGQRAVNVYADAAWHARQGGQFALESLCRHQIGWVLRPDVWADGGDWARAAESYAAAAALREQLELPAFAGLSLHEQAVCLVENDPAKMTPEARGLFARAAELRRQGGDPDGAAKSQSWLDG